MNCKHKYYQSSCWRLVFHDVLLELIVFAMLLWSSVFSSESAEVSRGTIGGVLGVRLATLLHLQARHGYTSRTKHRDGGCTLMWRTFPSRLAGDMRLR